jgi:hypothetical protein
MTTDHRPRITFHISSLALQFRHPHLSILRSAFCLSPISRTLMKHPRARSHFTAARATSGDLLRLALRIIRANPTKNLRSPTGAIVHHSGDAFCVMREA